LIRPAADSAAKDPKRRSAGDLLIRLGFAFFLFFLFPAFTIQLALDPVTMTFTGSLVLKIINLGCEIFSLTIVLRSRPAIDFVLRCRPILLLIGMAFMWTPFSYNPMGTLQVANVFFTQCMFGLAMVTRLGRRGSLRLVIATMAFGCALSWYWVWAYPLEAVHQASDVFQWQHAGLWRGIFSHKQGLGVFSGLTLGLLLFYGSITFPSLIIRLAAIGCASRCLIGSKSTTGVLVAILTPLVLYVTYWITSSPPQLRRIKMAFMPSTAIIVLLCFLFGAFDWIPEMFGKSTDMTGRADIWPLVIGNFNQSPAAFFGGGFGVGFAGTLSGYSVDNGYIDKLIEFGYIGVPIVYGAYVWIFASSTALIITTSREDADINVFPVSIWFVILFINVSESNFMYKHLCTVLTAIVVGFLTDAQRAPAIRKAGTDTLARSPMARSLRRRPAE
jgi:exopolysaccharide production protein ExoQ